MWNLLSLFADLFTSYRSYRDEKRTGRRSWAKFFVIVAFAAFEASLILAPMLLPSTSRFFMPTFLAGMAIALANFVWFVPLMRRFPRT